MRALTRLELTLTVIGLFVGTATPLRADVITTLFNTGVDANRNPLADATIGDPHYLLISVPNNTSTTDLRVRTSAGGYPINGNWLGDDAFSAWIGPNNSDRVEGPVGNYTYRTTFNLTGFSLPSVSLIGKWAADDLGADILLNGVSTGNGGAGFSSFSNFTITTGFQAGINTLDFLVQNASSATGVRVEMNGSGAAAVVPEPSSLILTALGAIGVVAMFARARTAEVAVRT